MIRGRAADHPARAVRLDAAIAGGFAVAAVWAVWIGPPVSDGTPGPPVLMTLFALLLAVPLFWRRDHPMLVECLVLAGFLGPAIVNRASTEGLPNLALLVAVYSAAAYQGRRDAVISLAIASMGLGVFLLMDANFRSGRAGELWAGAFFGVLLLAVWLAGLVVGHARDRRAQDAALAAQERESEAAVGLERSRIAHELHDIVSHNLSVVVVQAAGARAQGSTDSTDALEKIEASGRQALVEMRRLLGVLRDDDTEASLAPQPGITDLAALTDSVRAAGLPVRLTLSGDQVALPAALQLTVYRIVQEALTNAFKHAPGSETDVAVRCGADEVTIDVTNTGTLHVPNAPGSGGHGLLGMRERVERYGGQLDARPRRDGGFAVRARLPVQAGTR